MGRHVTLELRGRLEVLAAVRAVVVARVGRVGRAGRVALAGGVAWAGMLLEVQLGEHLAAVRALVAVLGVGRGGVEVVHGLLGAGVGVRLAGTVPLSVLIVIQTLFSQYSYKSYIV